MSTSYHLSERHFRLYEHYIERIVTAFPEIVTFSPTDKLGCETIASRIRICCDALRYNIHSGDALWTTAVSIIKFMQIESDLTVSTRVRPGFVVCGPESKIKTLKLQNHVPFTETPDQDTPTPRINLVNPSEDLIKAVVVFHHHKLFIEPSVIRSTYDLTTYKAFFDVEITKDGDTYTIL